MNLPLFIALVLNTNFSLSAVHSTMKPAIHKRPKTERITLSLTLYSEIGSSFMFIRIIGAWIRITHAAWKIHGILQEMKFGLNPLNLSSLPSFSILKYRNEPNLVSQIREASDRKTYLGLFWVSVYTRDTAMTKQWVTDPERS
jgi:hypothetical protein